MSGLEDQLRAALRAEAERFSARSDAWERAQERAQTRANRRRRPRLPAPAAAAAAVTVIIIAASFTVHRITSSTAPGAPRAGALVSAPVRAIAPAGPRAASGPGQQLIAQYPPAGDILDLAPGTVAAAYFWIGYPNATSWPDQITPGPLFCGDAVSAITTDSAGQCLAAGRVSGAGGLSGGDSVAVVTASGPADSGEQVLMGAAAAQVASVAALLPDGTVQPGVTGEVAAPRVKAWAVISPAAAGVRLIFRDAAGHQLAELGSSVPAGPAPVPRPASGGVAVSSDVTAYLVDGHAGFWSGLWGGAIAPSAAASGPAVAGLVEPFGPISTASSYGYKELVAFGYAHADVTRVVLLLAGGRQVTAQTFPAGWPGSDVRLWAIRVPPDGWPGGTQIPDMIVTAFGTAGQVLGDQQLGGGT